MLIAGWEILPDRHLVRRKGDERPLEPRLMQVLLHLAAHQGQVVTRTDLLAAVWGETFVQEEALTQAVSQLRRALDDDSRAPTVIETVPKQGYRLIAEVILPDQTEAGSAPAGRGFPWGPAAVSVMLVAVAVLVFSVFRSGDEPPATAPMLDEQPLTTLPGDEAFPAVSPDGSMVVFSLRPEGRDEFKLHLKRFGSEKLARLTEEPGQEFNPRWSPDGERIAFMRRDESGRRICMVPAMGGTVRELTPVYWMLGDLDWTPDGQGVVFSGKDRQETPMLLLRMNLADARLDTLTRPEQLSRGDNFPRFSPDGTRLAFVRGDRGSSRDVFVMPADGGDPRRLTHGFFSCGGLTWAPDGQSLILSGTLRGPFELWRIPADGGKPVLMPVKGHRSLQPTCPPGPGPLVFVDRTLDTDLEIGSLTTRDEAAVAAPSTRLDTSGRFSPDGSRILFISERSGSRELWVLDRADGTLLQLTEAAGDALGKPRWSPDGRRVAVNVAREGLLQVMVVDAASGLQRQVTPGDGHYRMGHWSADGRWIFYSREKGPDWQIAKVRQDGTGAVDVEVEGCHPLFERPDGTLLYFKEQAEGMFSRTGTGPEEIAVSPADLHDTGNLQVTPTGYWYIRPTDEGPRLTFFDFGTATSQDRALLTGDPTGELHVSADGTEYVITTVVQSGTDLVMVPEPR